MRRRRGSVIDEWLPMIEGMLAEDRETWRKQRHTATRIHERLRDGYGAGVSLSTVTRTVARLRREAAAEREACRGIRANARRTSARSTCATGAS